MKSYKYMNILLAILIGLMAGCASQPEGIESDGQVPKDLASAKRDPFQFICNQEQINGIAENFSSHYSAMNQLRQRAEIEAIFECNHNAFKASYLNYVMSGELERHEQGDIQFALSISPTGEVLTAEITYSDIVNAKLEKEIVDILKAVRFPSRDVALSKITFPISLKP